MLENSKESECYLVSITSAIVGACLLVLNTGKTVINLSLKNIYIQFTITQIKFDFYAI